MSVLSCCGTLMSSEKDRSGRAPCAHICLAAPQPLINEKLHLTSSMDTHLFFLPSSSSFGNGKVYKCLAINEASSALKVTARVDLNVCATLSRGSCWGTTPSTCSLSSDWALMVELNPWCRPVSTSAFFFFFSNFPADLLWQICC